MKKQSKLLLFSFSLPILSVYLFPASIQRFGSLYEYALGFPLRFVWYRNNEPLQNQWVLFSVEKYSQLQIDLLGYFLAVLLTYLVTDFLLDHVEQWLNERQRNSF